MKASPFSTTKTPTTAQSAPTRTLARRARRMKSNSRGAANQPTRLFVNSSIDGIELSLDAHQRHPALVGGVQRVLGQHCIRRTHRDDAAVETDDLVESLGD